MVDVQCPLCRGDGGELIAQNDLFRLVYANEPNFPGFIRLILNHHTAEMTDLSPEDQRRVMAAIFDVERQIRLVLKPHKINLASLGNMVPHVHWHIIPRYQDDVSYPGSVWSEQVRPANPNLIQERIQLAKSMRPALQKVCIE